MPKQTAKKATARKPGRQPTDRRRPAAPAAAPPAPATPGVIDLDAMRAARREAAGASIVVGFGGQEFHLPVELPLDAIEPLADLAELQDQPDDATEQEQVAQLRQVRGAMEASLSALFGPDEWPRFRDLRPTLEDMLALWESLFLQYGTSLGEALARTESAASGGAP